MRFMDGLTDGCPSYACRSSNEYMPFVLKILISKRSEHCLPSPDSSPPEKGNGRALRIESFQIRKSIRSPGLNRSIPAEGITCVTFPFPLLAQILHL